MGLNLFDRPTSDDRLWAGLSYAGLAPAMVPTVLILLWKKDESAFIRFHAIQAMVFGCIWSILFFLAFWVAMLPFVGWFIGALMLLAPPVYWIYLMFKAFSGQKILLPVLGAWIIRHWIDTHSRI